MLFWIFSDCANADFKVFAFRAAREKQKKEVAEGTRRSTRRGTRHTQRIGQKRLKAADEALMKERRNEQDPKREQAREKLVKKSSTDDLETLKKKKLSEMTMDELKRYATYLKIPAIGSQKYLTRSIKRVLKRRARVKRV